MAAPNRAWAHTAEGESANRHQRRQVHLYYPAEGFGCLYHRTMLNEFFKKLIVRSNIQTVAELPLDSYGIVGAGSLVFNQLGRKLTLVSDDPRLLERASALNAFNNIANVALVQSPLDKIPIGADSFDFSWSYERIQAVPNHVAVLDEICRVSKSVMVVVPNKYNYGQYGHFLYHRMAGTTCDYVGPKVLTRAGPIREMLRQRGLAIVSEGIIDIPWWPLFPELPNLVRRLVGRRGVFVDATQSPETQPAVVSSSDLPLLRRRVEQSALIERSRWLPRFAKLMFAHSVYLIGCKPRYREQLGL